MSPAFSPTTALLLVGLGLAVGSFGTLVGVGGGFLLAPILLILYPNESPQTITAISLAVVFVNSLSGAIAYGRQRRIDYRSGVAFGLAGVPGAIVGVLLVSVVPRQPFDAIFALVLLAVAAWLLIRTGRGVATPRPRTTGALRDITDRRGRRYQLPRTRRGRSPLRRRDRRPVELPGRRRRDLPGASDDRPAWIPCCDRHRDVAVRPRPCLIGRDGNTHSHGRLRPRARPAAHRIPLGGSHHRRTDRRPRFTVTLRQDDPATPRGRHCHRRVETCVDRGGLDRQVSVRRRRKPGEFAGLAVSSDPCEAVGVSSAVVGREVEIAAIEASLAAERPHPTGLLIEGEAGIGKTTVWREYVRRARARGLCVLATSATESEVKLSFAGLSDLLSSVPADLVSVRCRLRNGRPSMLRC